MIRDLCCALFRRWGKFYQRGRPLPSLSNYVNSGRSMRDAQLSNPHSPALERAAVCWSLNAEGEIINLCQANVKFSERKWRCKISFQEAWGCLFKCHKVYRLKHLGSPWPLISPVFAPCVVVDRSNPWCYLPASKVMWIFPSPCSPQLPSISVSV